jgi:uncharacterized membrane protein
VPLSWEVELNVDDDPASSGPEDSASGDEADNEGTNNEGLRLHHPGPVAEVAEAAGKSRELSQGPSSSDQGGVVERGSSNQGGLGGHPSQEQFPPVGTTNLEVVGYSWTSPIPPASELAGYEKIVPGSAERIIAMAELALRSPIENTTKQTDAEIEVSKDGLSFAKKLTVVMVAAALVFLALGVAGIGTAAAITAGGICVSVPVIMLIRSFIGRS